MRRAGREMVKRKMGIVHASASAEGSATSRTPRRAAQRRRRALRELKAWKLAGVRRPGTKVARQVKDRRFGIINPGPKE